MLCCVVCSTSTIPVQAPTQWQVDTAVLRLHSRRCTCLEFHPTRDNIVLSGDKKGQVAIWDHAKVYDRTVYNLNKALTNNLRFLPGSDGMQCCSASSDGTLKVDCTLCALVACQSLAVEQQIAGCLVPHTASLCTWSLFRMVHKQSRSSCYTAVTPCLCLSKEGQFVLAISVNMAALSVQVIHACMCRALTLKADVIRSC